MNVIGYNIIHNVFKLFRKYIFLELFYFKKFIGLGAHFQKKKKLILSICLIFVYSYNFNNYRTFYLLHFKYNFNLTLNFKGSIRYDYKLQILQILATYEISLSTFYTIFLKTSESYI